MVTIEHVVILTQLNGTCGITYALDINVDIESFQH